uniref:Uncharacterized protein n=1 Tax=Escherichia coli TaxID=562 RepID=Q6KDF4_ECOLX|nr:hypothetical protein [Escherichia coli Nissle 1917]
MNGVVYISDFGEHHRCAAAHQQVRGVADSGVSGNAGERVAATAVHAHHQLGGRAGDALAWLSFSRWCAAACRISSTIDLKPTCCSSCRRTMLALSTGMLCTSSVPFCRRYGCSFSQPRPTTITSPPKFGFSAILWMVRIGTTAVGALIATPQP